MLFFGAASVLYFILNRLVDKVIGAPVGSAYHWMHPYAFLMVFTVAFMITLLLLVRKKIVESSMFYLTFYVLWIVLSLVCSGLLWSFFDMNAGYFPQGYDFLKNYFQIFYGLTWTGLAIFSAIPFNILVFVVSFFIIRNYKTVINNKS